MCCACKDVCQDQDQVGNERYVNSLGYGCEFYDANPILCGNYDTDQFISTEICCACQCSADEGDYSNVDSEGKNCTAYSANITRCGLHDDGNFIAS